MIQNDPANFRIKVGIIGIGFVGLPLCQLFVQKGFDVIGIDINEEKIRKLKNGESYIPDIADEEIDDLNRSGHFQVTSDYHVVKNLDLVVISVPTPLSENQTPDLSNVQQVANQIIRYITKNQTVILESSTYPGTTREVLMPLLEKSGLTVGKDLFLAYSPERIDPGNKTFKPEQIPKVLSGITQKCTKKAYSYYKQAYDTIVTVSSPEVAELTKLIENCYRFINISFINEVSMMCDTMNINLWEAIEAAATKPYGFQKFYPGPGIGGHCIPVDPLYLQWKAGQYNTQSKFIELSSRINRNMPKYVIETLEKYIDIKQSMVLIYGISYKKDTNDVRESISIEVARQLLSRGASIFYHDPYVPFVRIGNKEFSSIPLTKNIVSNVDAVLILTDHSLIPKDLLINHASLIYDTRNVLSDERGKAKIIKLGG